MEDGLEFLFGDVVVNVKRVERTGGHVVLVFEDAEQQVLSADHCTFENLGLEVGDLEDLFGLFYQGNVALAGGGRLVGLDRILHGLTQTFQVYVQPLENADRSAFAFANDSQQQVLHANVAVAKAQGLFSTVSDHVLHTG